jgi:hypothetical protein
MRRLFILIVIFGLAAPIAFGQGAIPERRARQNCNLATIVADLPYMQPSAPETAAMVFMREEEKLARDVYQAMDDLWGLRIFRNIQRAEQSHMDAVLALLEKYGIVDPSAGASAGQFTNPDLQELYNQLVARGEVSLLAALEVGVTVEEMDITDLLTSLEIATGEDIRTVFQNLAKGSRNHLRSFFTLLEANGVDYEPIAMDPGLFDEIVLSAKERGLLDGDGNLSSKPACTWDRNASGNGRDRRWRR